MISKIFWSTFVSGIIKHSLFHTINVHLLWKWCRSGEIRQFRCFSDQGSSDPSILDRKISNGSTRETNTRSLWDSYWCNKWNNDRFLCNQEEISNWFEHPVLLYHGKPDYFHIIVSKPMVLLHCTFYFFKLWFTSNMKSHCFLIMTGCVGGGACVQTFIINSHWWNVESAVSYPGNEQNKHGEH